MQQTPNPSSTWSKLTEAQRAQVIAILVQMLLRQLAKQQEANPSSQIAAELNQASIQTSQGKPFTARRVQGLRRRYGIHKRSANPDSLICF